MATNEHGVDALLPGRLGMVVRLVSHPGARLALLDAVNRYADNLEQEPGTEAFDDHREAHAFAELMKELPNLLSQPPAILRMDPLRMFIQKELVDGAF